MSKETESKTCAFCHGILFEEDDVVVCPDCGAPHHRECWQKAGKCAFWEVHGTDLQYDRAEKLRAEQRARAEEEAKKRGEVICNNCGKPTFQGNRFCSNCGAEMPKENHRPNVKQIDPTTFFTSTGDLDKNEEIEAGITVEEVSAFLGIRTFRFAKKFKENRKACWNWVAFLVPASWYAFHKMYKYMAAALTAFFAGIVCFVPFISEINAALSTLPLPQTNAEEAEMLKESLVLALENAPVPTLLLAFLGFLIISASMLLSGFFGERAYRSVAIEKITKIKSQESIEDPLKEMAAAGGTNIFLAGLVLVLLAYPDVIIGLITSVL